MANHAPGKAVKMVYRLLYDLPPKFTYRVLFMQRKLDEVLVSQKTCLYVMETMTTWTSERS